MDGSVETTVPNAAATANARNVMSGIGRPPGNQTGSGQRIMLPEGIGRATPRRVLSVSRACANGRAVTGFGAPSA